jgi:hypothetical protein
MTQTERKYSDEFLDNLDPYAPCIIKKVQCRKPQVKVRATDPETCLRAALREDYWLAAAAFGAGDSDNAGNREVDYLDAIMALAASPPKEDRRKWRARSQE